MEVFLHFLWWNIQKFMMSHHQNFLCQNQSKSSTAFLTLDFLRAIYVCGYPVLPRFVKVLYLSSICVNFQPTQCIFTINFKHFPSSPNYVRGVREAGVWQSWRFLTRSWIRFQSKITSVSRGKRYYFKPYIIWSNVATIWCHWLGSTNVLKLNINELKLYVNVLKFPFVRTLLRSLMGKGIDGKCYSKIELEALMQTRPDTRHTSRGRLGRGNNAAIQQHDISDRPTDRHGKF